MELERLPVGDLGDLPRNFTWLSSMANLALACVGLDDAIRAQRVYDLLLPFAASNTRATRIGVSCYGSVAHYLGLLAATLRRWDDATLHLEAALDMHHRLGAPVFLANTRLHLARVLRARHQPGDVDRAEEDEHTARSAARAQGIVLHLEWRE